MISGWLWQPEKRVGHLQSPPVLNFSSSSLIPSPWANHLQGWSSQSAFVPWGLQQPFQQMQLSVFLQTLSAPFSSSPLSFVCPQNLKRHFPRDPRVAILERTQVGESLYTLCSPLLSLPCQPQQCITWLSGAPPFTRDSSFWNRPRLPLALSFLSLQIILCFTVTVTYQKEPLPPLPSHLQLQPGSRWEQDPLSSYLQPFLPFSSPQLLSCATH